jgi:peptide/nickel transport system permease protein
MTVRRIPITARVGLAGVATVLFIAVFAELLAPYGEAEIVGGVWEPSSSTFLLGTDNLGRDLLSRLIHGAKITVLIALVASVLSFSMGITLSFTAAVLGGWVDRVLSRLNDLAMAIPALILALVILAAVPQNLVMLTMVMAGIDATRVFRIGRSLALDIGASDYVEAAWLRGEGTVWVIFREILPNAMAPLLAEFGLRFAFLVLFLSTLSFLGLGVQPPMADWGGMVRDNKEGIIFGIPAALIPGAAIALLAVNVNLVVDWAVDIASSMRGNRG